MSGILARLFSRSVATIKEEKLSRSPVRWPKSLGAMPAAKRGRLEELVILGVLLNEIAKADGHFDPAEEKAIKKILSAKQGLTPQEVALVLAAARQSESESIDMQSFTREINKRPYKERIHVVELLFQIAFADNKLSMVEHEAIRKFANLFWVSHKDFIAAKLRVRDS